MQKNVAYLAFKKKMIKKNPPKMDKKLVDFTLGKSN